MEDIYQQIERLEPRTLFRHFAKLLQIPRPSGGEDAAVDYLVDFARSKGLSVSVGPGSKRNVMVRVPPTPGLEAVPTVVLQGHLDMVCVKAEGAPADPEKDPIPVVLDEGWIRTNGTTLGADNGIGIAAALALAEDDCRHGPLEILATVEEETGMFGAFQLEPDFIEGRILLNLDSEEEGTFFVGCAGGGDTILRLPLRTSPVEEGFVCLRVKARGLAGGHSGLTIHEGRANALQVLAEAVSTATEGTDFRIGGLKGGDRRNTIPKDAELRLFVRHAQEAMVRRRISEFHGKVAQHFQATDPDLSIDVGACEDHCPAYEGRLGRDLLWLLREIPHGVIAMSKEIEGVVQTSNNLAIVRQADEHVEVICNSRSSIESEMEETRSRIADLGRRVDAEVALEGKYPAWTPNMNSRLIALAKEVWKKLTGSECRVTAIHAGLECGVIGDRVPGMDMISFGPTIQGAHTPDERVSTESTRLFYDALKSLVERLARGQSSA